MPISSSAASLERKRFRLQSSTSIEHTKRTQNKNFLTIEPALPTADKARQLYKRSNSTLSSTSNIKNDSYAAVTLQPYPDGSVHILRTSQEKEKNPDRLCLDRRGLTVLPILEEEVNLRLLSLQHNLVNSLEGFKHQGFPFLVFLDIYDNQLERIHCLDRLENLRVLLMGKNRIKRIEGLENLVKIEVLDLHGNLITHIGGLTNLNQLKVLNLAGNQIKNVGLSDLRGLTALQEFNLRRNKLKKLLGFGETTNLQKLFLSNNEIHAVEDMCSVAKAVTIKEIAVDNNPISLGGDCISFLVSYLPQLGLLNGMQITEQVRKAAMAWRRNKESSNAAYMDLTSDVCLNVSNEVSFDEKLRFEQNKNLKPDCDFILTSLGKPELRSSTSRTKSRVINNTVKVPLLPDKKLSVVRTPSQDTENSQNTSSSNTSGNEFFRLPPILVPIINKIEQKAEPSSVKESSIKLSGSLSSIGPNIDSSVSSLLSNSESSDSDSESESSSNKEEDIIATDSKAFDLRSPEENITEELKITSSSLNIVTDTSSTISTTTTASNATASTSGSDGGNRNASKTRSIKSAAITRSAHTKIRSRPVTAKPKRESPTIEQPIPDKDREQGGDYLIEICGRHLNIYGQTALRFIDKSWSMSKAKDVNTVNFNYANFNAICTILNKLKLRFPNIDNLVFKDTNIQHLGQLNALAEVQGLLSLVISEEGNPIIQKNWQSYAIYRLSHWGLRSINGKEVVDVDIQQANQEYQSLSDLVLWSLPSVLLQPLILRLQLDISNKFSEHNAKKWLLSADPALRNVVIKETLQWKKGAASQEDLMLRQKAKTHMGAILTETCNAVNKLRLLEEQWPSIFHETVRNILLDYTQLDMYMKSKLQELK